MTMGKNNFKIVCTDSSVSVLVMTRKDEYTMLEILVKGEATKNRTTVREENIDREGYRKYNSKK